MAPPQNPQSHLLKRASSGTDVGVLQSGLLAAAITAGVFVGLLPRLPDGSIILRLLAEGWVPKAVVLLSSWSAVILLLKLLALWHQRRALAHDLLPLDLCDSISSDNVDTLCSHLDSVPRRLRRSLVYCRLARGLDFFRSHRHAQHVATHLAQQSELDAMAVDSSYSMVKAFLWAIPMLGFVGTVIGIGDAVGSFSDSVAQASSSLSPEAQVANLKTSLGGVTSGLGLAFDTTLIALVLSILLMLLMNWLSKAEDDLLTEVSDYGDHRLLMRIRGSTDDAVRAEAHPGVDLEPVVREIQALVAEAGAGQEHSLAAWQKTLDHTYAEVARQSETAWTRAAELLGEHKQLISASMKSVTAASESLQVTVKEGSTEYRETLDAIRQELRRRDDAVADLAESVRAGVAAATTAAAPADRSEKLEEVLRGLCGELRDSLGEHLQRFERMPSEVAGALQKVAEAALAHESAQARGAERVAEAMSQLSRSIGTELPALAREQVAALGHGAEQFRELAELQKVQVEELREAVGSQPFRVYLSVLARELSRMGDLLEQMTPRSARKRYWFGRGRETDGENKAEGAES